MSVKNLLCSSAFMMGTAVIVSLITYFAGVFPADVLTAPTRSTITIFLLAFMMTLSFSRFSYKDLNPVENIRSVSRAVILGLVVASVIPLIGYFIIKGIDGGAYETYAVGLVFIAATPFAASVAPLSLILRGDLRHALRSTIIVYIIAMLWIPAIIYLCLGHSVDMVGVLKTVIEIIGIPLILSRLFTKVKIDKTTMSIVLNCIIFFLVWMSVSSANFGFSATVLVILVLVAVLRTFFLGNAVEYIERKQGIEWSQRVTDILMTSYKNKGIAIAVCVSLAGSIMVPNAMAAIATSIVVEVLWVAFMDSVLFSKKRMVRELQAEGKDVSDLM